MAYSPRERKQILSLRDFGIELRRPRLGENRTACPKCGRRHDDALAVLIEDGGAFVFLCHRCGWSGGSKGVTAEPLQLPPAPPRPPPRDWRPTWQRSQQIEPGTLAAAYLQHRGCALPHPAGDLRWLAAERHPSSHVGPALVALVTDAVTGAPMTLHRTWIAADGQGKARIDRPRLLWAGADKRGGCCRLWPDDFVTTGLALAEGVETALCLARGYGSAWSTIDAGNLGAFPVLEGVEALTIAVDNDEAGLRAAAALGDRWIAAGREVREVIADRPGADFADLAAELAA